jgi:hypothetical protein
MPLVLLKRDTKVKGLILKCKALSGILGYNNCPLCRIDFDVIIVQTNVG